MRSLRKAPVSREREPHKPNRFRSSRVGSNYVRAQRDFADEAAVLRTRLIAVCDQLLAAEPATAAPAEPDALS